MERLGWITSCGYGTECPQVWLERSVTEIPVEVACARCGHSVALVASQRDLDAREGRSVAAWPVVPPIALRDPATGEARSRPPAAATTGPALEAPRRDTRSDPHATAEGTSEDWAPVAEAWPAPPEVDSRRSPVEEARVLYVELDSGERVALNKPTMVIGRSRACDVIIPSAKVSRQHATLTWVGPELFIEDLGSANGVWRDGHKLTRDRIAPGDVIRISDETLRFVPE